MKKTSRIWEVFFWHTAKKNPPKGRLKMASDLHRTAQPLTLAMFPSWGSLQELVV